MRSLTDSPSLLYIPCFECASVDALTALTCCPTLPPLALSAVVAPVRSTAVKLEMRSYFLSFLDRFRPCPSCCRMLVAVSASMRCLVCEFGIECMIC